MDTIASYICPCGCGDTVAVTFTGGFAGVTCEVRACPTMQAAGTVAYTVRRSAPLGWTPAGWSSPTDDGSALRHRNGLVTFG